MKARFFHWWIACLVFCLGTTGCGKKAKPQQDLIQVTGTIEVDGTPLERGSILFSPDPHDRKSVAPIGMVGISGVPGRFHLSTNGMPGSPRGRYKVMIFVGKAGQVREGAPFDRKYSCPEETPLTVEVKEHGPEVHFDFNLSRS